jgi:hypothetical protein
MGVLLVKITAYRVAILYLALLLQQAAVAAHTNLVLLVALVALAGVEQVVEALLLEAAAQEYQAKEIVAGQEPG